MRVVAGKYRGKNLVVPKGDSVRPTTTRIKETLFNILQRDIPSANVLDLFAGCGSLGIESISRGAEHVTFVDASRTSIAAVKENLKGVVGSYDVVNADFMSALMTATNRGYKYDVIFIDPPYASGLGEVAIDTIISRNLLAEDGVIVFEHGAEKKYIISDARYKQRTKNMGTVTVEFITRKRIALMTGSFDPFTKGHEVVLDEALERYDEVVVGCFINPDKEYTFSDEMRLAIVERVCQTKKGARAILSRGYVYQTATEIGATALIRGLRDGDEACIAYENEMAKFNADHGFETVFITPHIHSDVSSTSVRAQIEKGDYSGVPPIVADMLTKMQ